MKLTKKEIRGMQMVPEDDPRFERESHPCPDDCGGNVTKSENNIWSCDNCDWSPVSVTIKD